MVNLKTWRIIPRPLLETILNNHVQHHLVHQPLILHGPRGAGKTTLIRDRLFDKWNAGPHITGYVDFAEAIEEYHPKHGHSYPWTSWTNCPPCRLVVLKDQLENCLESMIRKAIMLGAISSHQIFSKLTKWHSPTTVLSRILNSNSRSEVHSTSKRKKLSVSNLWDSAVFKLISGLSEQELDGVLDESITVDTSFCKESLAALKLAKKVIVVQQKWREDAVLHMNSSGRFSRSLVNSATDWPCLLLELLSSAAEMDYFQPKLVINNIEVLKNAITEDDRTVCGSMYHDSLIWRMIALGANEKSLPVILVTSDGYYSYKAFLDFGFRDIFISRENFGWTPAEAQMHMVDDYFSQSEWTYIVDALGPSPRHLFELHMLKSRFINSGSIFDILDLYLPYLQTTVVNPAMDRALSLLEKFAIDAQSGKILKERLCFGAPWRHPPKSSVKTWVKIQMMDFVQSLVVSEFGVNYLADSSLEFFDDPAAIALLEVGLLYTQRDPSFIRPVTRGIERCLMRWLIQERIGLSLSDSILFHWQRIVRGRSYRHLMLQEGYK